MREGSREEKKRRRMNCGGGDVVWGEPVWRGRRGSRIAVSGGGSSSSSSSPVLN